MIEGMWGRWKSLAPEIALAAAVLSGCVAMFMSGALAHYALVNLAALSLGLAVSVLVRRGACTWRSFLWIAPIGLALTLFLGLEIDGVSRWLGSSPLAIHTGMLLLPGFCIIAARHFDRTALAAVGVIAVALALQPDRGTALAFFCAMAVVALLHRTPSSGIAAGIAALGLAATYMQTDPLAPIPFVEGVLQDAWRQHAGVAILLALALAAAIAVPLEAAREGAALGAFVAGLTLASLLGPYPTPLIGYGTAPILGYALALGFIRSKTPSTQSQTAPDCHT